VSTPPPIQREIVALLDHPREDLNTEIKDWLDLAGKGARANLARELLALANHGGGYVLFGFKDTTTGWIASGTCPHKPEHYSQDEINNILKAHAEPVFECYTYHLQSSAGDEHVVIQVPGDHTVPIRARGGPSDSRLTDHSYYIRRPGPESAPPDNAHEWDELITRCVDNNHQRNVDSMRRIVDVIRTAPDIAAALAEQTGTLAKWSEESLNRLETLEAQQDG
jgi:predicted HTH transcriptional regulator